MSQRKVPRPCKGYGKMPCPHNATVPSKHADRCKSCAARQRLLERPRAEVVASIARARGVFADVYAGEPFDSAKVRRILDQYGTGIREAGRELGWHESLLIGYLHRGRIPYHRLDELACWLDTHPDSLRVVA